MKNKALNYLFIALIIIGIIAVTIVASYYGSLLFTSERFNVGYFLPFVGFVAVDVVLVGLSFKFMINIIGGKK